MGRPENTLQKSEKEERKENTVPKAVQSIRPSVT